MNKYYVEFKLPGTIEFDNYYGDYVLDNNANQALNSVCDWFFDGNPDIKPSEVQYRILKDDYLLIDEGWCD